NLALILELTILLILSNDWPLILMCFTCPLLLLNTTLYVFVSPIGGQKYFDSTYKAVFKVRGDKLQLNNIKRGVSIIGSAGSGKTECVVYQFLKHFRKKNFCGVIHDYKDFELTEIAFSLFKDQAIPFKIVSFDK